MMNYIEIQHVRLSETERPKALAVLRCGALLLKKWSSYYHSKKFRQFRNDVMRGDKNPQKAIPAERLPEFHADLPHILAIRKPDPELGGRSVEEAVLQSFGALAKQHANQWVLDGDPNGISRNDYIQEAYMTIIEAMYQYTREDVDLTTFVWHSLRHRMINVTNNGNLFCPLTNSDLDLVIRYDRIKKSNGGTFDEIVESLGLSEKEGLHLGSILSKVISENQLTSEAVSIPSNDYTSHRVGIDSLSPMIRTEMEKDSDGEIVVSKVIDVEGQEYVNNVFASAKLTTLERKILEVAMEPYHGWQTDFAKNHINPETGKPYSRMRITQVLEKARAKVQKVLELAKEAA